MSADSSPPNIPSPIRRRHSRNTNAIRAASCASSSIPGAELVRRLVVPLNALEAADPSRFGAKAANLAALKHAGLPVPEGFCVDAQAYRMQLSALGLEESARGVFSSEDRPDARRRALDTKLGLMQGAIAPEVLEQLLFAWRSVAGEGRPGVVRSSALVEDRAGASFAGQFQSYLGIESDEDFLTAVRACW